MSGAVLARLHLLAQELMSYNPGHGDFRTAGQRLISVLEGGDRDD